MSRNYNPNWRGGLARPRNNGRYGLPGGHYNPNQNYRCRGGGQHGNNCGCVYTLYPRPICFWSMPPPLKGAPRKAEPQPDPSTFDGMHINQMIEDCLIMMFRKFAIHEQVRFRLVCQRWKEVLDRMFSNRKSIKLFGNSDDIFTYCKEIARFNLHRNEDFILRLSRERNDELVIRRGDEVLYAIPLFFPNLRRLLICHNQTEWHRVLPDVLTWLPHLESLTLFDVDFSSDMRPERDNFRASKFWSSINQLYNLKELHLLHAWMVQIPFDLYVLNRLKQFTLTSHRFHTGACIQELSSNLQVLRLANVTISNDQLRLCLDANPGMARNLRHLTIGQLWTNDNQTRSYTDLVAIICDYFKNLSTLDLLFSKMRFVDLMTELSKLTALVDLTINVDHPDQKLHFENATLSPQLHSVKRLSVQGCGRITKDNLVHIFPRVFPFLEFLRLDSLYTNELDKLLDGNLSNLFTNLVELEPILAPIHDLARVAEGDYAFAGRHRMQYIEHLCEVLPEVSFDSEQDFWDGL